MSKVQSRMFQKFMQRLFGLCFLMVLFFSVITPSDGICSSENIKANFTVSSNQVCLGQGITFTSTSEGSPRSIFWDIDNNGSVDYSGHTINHIYTQPGTYSVRLLIIGEKSVDIEVKENLITVHSGIKLSVLTNRTEVCNGQTVLVNAQGGISYKWEYSDGSIWNGLSSIVFKPTVSGTLKLTGSNQFGCSEVMNIPIKVNNGPSAKMFITHPTEGNNGQLSVFGENGLAPYLYRINNGGYMYNNIYNNLPPGDHILYIKDANGCESRQNFRLNAPIACGKPQNLTLAQLRSSDIVLTWKEVPGAINYTLFGTNANGETATIDWNEAGVRISGLTPNMSYNVYVVANCINGKSEPSNVLHFSTPNSNTCPRPNVWVSEITSHSAKVNYNYTKTGSVNNLVIWYRKNGAFNWDQMLVLGNSSSFELNNLSASSEYELRVGTICQGSNAVWSETITFRTIPSATCTAPDAVTVTPSIYSANVSWEMNPSVTAYAIRWKLTGSVRWNTRVLNGNTQNFVITDLKPSSIYDLKLTKICNNTESDGWIAQFNTVSAKESDFIPDNASISIYPNPNAGNFYVNIPDKNIESATVQLTDLTGKMVYNRTFNLPSESGRVLSINPTLINTGIYQLSIITESNVLNQKIIIE